MKGNLKSLMVATALAAGVPLHLLGHFRGMKPMPTKRKALTQADHDAIAQAQAKRERKAEKRRVQGL